MWGSTFLFSWLATEDSTTIPAKSPAPSTAKFSCFSGCDAYEEDVYDTRFRPTATSHCNNNTSNSNAMYARIAQGEEDCPSNFDGAEFPSCNQSRSHIDETMSSKRTCEAVHLHTKKPRWNREIKHWVHNFGGRVKIASNRNFLMVQTTDEEAMADAGPRKGSGSVTLDILERAIIPLKAAAAFPAAAYGENSSLQAHQGPRLAKEEQATERICIRHGKVPTYFVNILAHYCTFATICNMDDNSNM
jgi:hypothetical protein